MRLKFEALPLDTHGAQLLRKILVGERSNSAADALIAHVFELGARYAILESPYTDLDYTADYQTFYAGAFKDYPRQTQRLHLFGQDVSGILEGPFEAQTEGLSKHGYLGFVVIRPISQGPIGRTVLNYPELDDGLIIRRAARAPHRVHLAGAELVVEGAPFIQQEAKVGACAQAAIWMAALPVHLRHRAPRFSIAEITRLAVTPIDAVLSQALPAGSKGLNPAHMIRALRGMGHQPLFDVFKGDRVSVPPNSASMVLRYLDSSLPVILAMDAVGHAVTAVGYVETPGAALASGDTYDVFTHALLVHDDQRGPYRLLPLRLEDVDRLPRSRLMMHEDVPLTVETAVSHMFVPLPPRVFLPAHRADIIARDFIQRQALELGPEIVQMTRVASEASAAVVERFYESVVNSGIVRRTYLTSAARYRHYLAKSNASPSVKLELLDRTLPHYVWVTELIARDGSTADRSSARTIIGHLVVNATSSSDLDSDLLAAHTPHVVTHRDINGEETSAGDVYESAVLIDNDHPYAGRHRR